MLARTGRPRRLDAPVWVFAIVGVAVVAFAIALAVDREAPPGGVWPTLGVAALLLLPAVLVLAGRTPAIRVEVDVRDLESMASIATAFTRPAVSASVARDVPG